MAQLGPGSILQDWEALHRLDLQGVCSGRQGFATLAGAHNSIVQLGPRLRQAKAVYACPTCSYFHVASVASVFRGVEATMRTHREKNRAISTDMTLRLKNRVYTAAEAGRRIAAKTSIDPKLEAVFLSYRQ